MNSDMLTKARGLDFNYRAHGVGPTLVLLHAFPMNLRMWEAQLTGLNRECHMVAMDLRGFGASQTTDGDFTLEDMARDVRELVHRLGHDRFVLGGMSMGGYVALAYQRLFPADLRGLVLANTRASADSPDAREKRLLQAAQIDQDGTRGLARSLPPSLIAPASQVARPELLDRMRVWIEDTDPRTVAGALRAIAGRPDATDQLARIAVPTLVIASDEDALTPSAEVAGLAAAIPGATLVHLPKAGHLSALDQPEAFNAAVRSFMAQFAS